MKSGARPDYFHCLKNIALLNTWYLGLESVAFCWSTACSWAPKTPRARSRKPAAPRAGAAKVTGKKVRGLCFARLGPVAGREAQKALARTNFSAGESLTYCPRFDANKTGWFAQTSSRKCKDFLGKRKIINLRLTVEYLTKEQSVFWRSSLVKHHLVRIKMKISFLCDKKLII